MNVCKRICKLLGIGLLMSFSESNVIAGLPQCGATGKTPEQLVQIYKDRQSYPNFVLICAHRGIWIHRDNPQNSQASIQNAIDAGVDCVENDIRWTSDDIAVIFHDLYMDMMVVDENGQPVTGKIQDYTWAQLQTYRLRDRLLNVTSQRIISLQEFIQKTKGKIVENHEIKIKKKTVGPERYKQRFAELILLLHQNGVLSESIIKGELTSAEYASVRSTVASHGVDISKIVYVPKFFSETPNINSEITAFNAQGVTSYELVVENDTTPLIKYFNRLDKENKRYGAFDLIPESGRGRFLSTNEWRQIDPTKDFRGDWEWIFKRHYSFLITDRPCMASTFLTRLGLRQIP